MKCIRTFALCGAALLVLSGVSCSTKEKGEVLPPKGEYDAAGGYLPQVPDVQQALTAAMQKNSEVVGWLQVPNTAINEAVVQGRDNEFYMRRDAEKNYAYEGSYYLDYESVIFDDGADLAQNSIIYGHNLGDPLGVKDNPDGKKFAQLLKLEDPEIARKTPYLYLSTPAKTHIFEVFAVLYCESVTSPIPYHYAEYSEEQFTALVTDMRDRSLFDYEVEVTPNDRLLTLSTCSYKYGTYSQNRDQRYIVMARLVQEGEGYHELATLEPNPSPKQPAFLSKAA